MTAGLQSSVYCSGDWNDTHNHTLAMLKSTDVGVNLSLYQSSIDLRKMHLALISNGDLKQDLKNPPHRIQHLVNFRKLKLAAEIEGLKSLVTCVHHVSTVISFPNRIITICNRR